MAEDTIITLNGEKIDYSKLSDKELIELYIKLKDREVELYNKIKNNIKK